jgi:predicted dehydrogenase
MHILLAGVGIYGIGWYHRLKRDYADSRITVVDRNPATAQQLAAGDAFYTSLHEALEMQRPDFVINATPPAAHAEVNHLAFDHRLPVLCEKPISDSYPEALEMVRRAVSENIPFMIAENYRRTLPARRVKHLIARGDIGRVTSIHVLFRRYFHTDKAYFVAMEHPLLIDVAIHHLDLMRYFTGSEGARLFAHSYNPAGSWTRGNMNLSLLMTMQDETRITYDGSMVAQTQETDWSGDWIIEGTTGAITLRDGAVTLIKDREPQIITDDQVRAGDCLDEFVAALRNDTIAESWGTDYIHTQKLVHCALESHRANAVVTIGEGL